MLTLLRRVLTLLRRVLTLLRRTLFFGKADGAMRGVDPSDSSDAAGVRLVLSWKMAPEGGSSLSGGTGLGLTTTVTPMGSGGLDRRGVAPPWPASGSAEGVPIGSEGSADRAVPVPTATLRPGTMAMSQYRVSRYRGRQC